MHKWTLCRRSEAGDKQERHAEGFPKPADAEGQKLACMDLFRVVTSSSPRVILPGGAQPLVTFVIELLLGFRPTSLFS